MRAQLLRKFAAMGLALVGYAVYPTAPPRYMPEWGFSDTVAQFVGPQAEASVNMLYNPFAAVPSMHVAFALMIAIPAMRIVKHRAAKVLWGIYPAVVTFVVVVTANHFWLDAALGALVAAISAWGASYALGRARPDAVRWFFARMGYPFARDLIALRRAIEPELRAADRWDAILAAMIRDGAPDTPDALALTGRDIAGLLGEPPSARTSPRP